MSRCIIEVAYGATISGGERVLASIVEGLLERGDRVVAVVPAPGPVEELLRSLGAETQVMDVRKTYDLRAAYRLARLAREVEAAAVQTHGFLRNLHGRLARALFGGAPHVGVVHRAMGWHVPGAVRGLREHLRVGYYTWLERLTLPASAATVAVSTAVRDDLVARGLPSRAFTVVANGIARDPPVTSPEEAAARRRELGLGPEARLLFTAARLSPLKDLPTMVAGLAAPGAQGWHLAIAGDGPARDDIVGRARAAGVEARVHLLGRREDVPAWLAAADAFGLSSRSGEGLPIALLEAMRAGLPAVVTREPGTLAAVRPGRTALVVPVGDSAAFGRALGDLSQPGELERWGRAARTYFLEAFTEERMVAAHLACLDRAASG